MGLIILSFYPMGSFILRVESDSLRMVSFRVKVWVTRIVFSSNEIIHSQSRGRLNIWKLVQFFSMFQVPRLKIWSTELVRHRYLFVSTLNHIVNSLQNVFFLTKRSNTATLNLDCYLPSAIEMPSQPFDGI